MVRDRVDALTVTVAVLGEPVLFRLAETVTDCDSSPEVWDMVSQLALLLMLHGQVAFTSKFAVPPSPGNSILWVTLIKSLLTVMPSKSSPSLHPQTNTIISSRAHIYILFIFIPF